MPATQGNRQLALEVVSQNPTSIFSIMYTALPHLPQPLVPPACAPLPPNFALAPAAADDTGFAAWLAEAAVTAVAVSGDGAVCTVVLPSTTTPVL